MQHSPLRVLSFPFIGALVAACAAIALCASLCVAAPAAYAVTAAEKQAEAEEALANLNAMQETLDRLSAEYGEALAAQEAAEQARDAAQARIEEISAEIADLQDRLGTRAREMYRSGGVSFIEILLGASSFENFATSWDMLNKVNENDADMVAQQKALRGEAEQQEAEYAAQAEVAAQKSAEAAEAEAQAEATVAEMQALYDSLSEEAAKLLEECGISAEVVNICTIKPLDEDLIVAEAEKCGAIVTCEEHNIIGGLGSAVNEVVCEKCPVPVLRVGIADEFGRSGSVEDLLERYKLTPAEIVNKAKAAIALKA